jgi:hypothetical protein
MKVYLVEASFVVSRRVAVEISADSEEAAESEMLRLMQGEPEACQARLQRGMGGSGRVSTNTAEMLPEIVMVSLAETAP